MRKVVPQKLLSYFSLSLAFACQGSAQTSSSNADLLLSDGLVEHWLGPKNFDGVDEHVNLGAVDVSGSAMTLAARVQSDDLKNCNEEDRVYNDCRIISRATGVAEQDHDFMLSTVRYGKFTRLRFRLRTNGTTKTLIGQSSDGNIFDGDEVHVTAVYDGAKMKLYKDGALVGETTQSGDITLEAPSTWVGGNPSGKTDRPWNGRIEDVRVYDRALTDAEIQKLADMDRQEPVETERPPRNSPPIARDLSITTANNTAIKITLSASDSDRSDTLVYKIIQDPKLGTVTRSEPVVFYTPKSTGTDSFVYQVTDGNGGVDTATVRIVVEEEDVGTIPGRVTTIARSKHPNLYFNRGEIETIRQKMKNGTAPQAALSAWGRIKDARAVGKPNSAKNSLGWKAMYKVCQPLSKRNMDAAMSYLIEPTASKASAIKAALLSWTKLGTNGDNWANGGQRGGHMQFPLAFMYDLIYNEGVLSETDKTDIDAFMRDRARLLSIKAYGTNKVIDKEGSKRGGYDNFFILDRTAGVVFGLVSHSQEAVDRIFQNQMEDGIVGHSIPDDYYMYTHPGFNKKPREIRSLGNLIQGEIFPSGYTWDGYSRNYGFNTSIGFKGEDKGDGQHYHFFALLGLLPAAEAAFHNGFDAWSYEGNLLLRGFTTGASWAHTAFREGDGDPNRVRNHTPLYWIVARRYPTNSTIKSVIDRSESKSTYSYFFSNVAPIWSLAR